MADITKCCGAGCPTKEDCYRYLAYSFIDCQYVIGPLFDDKIGKCPMFWSVVKERRKEMPLGLTEMATQGDNVKETTQTTNDKRNGLEGA